jgi:hypothetical protein
MGDRAYIVIQSTDFDSDLVFYGHWAGEQGYNAVTQVLSRTDRIGDPNYLAAQIFYEFSKGYEGTLGFGISAINPTDGYFDWADNPVVYVNADTGKYSVGGDTWVDRFGNDAYKDNL